MTFLTKNLILFSEKINIYDLAKRTGKDSTTLNKIVNGTSTNPTINNLIIIFNELKQTNLVNSFDDLIFKDLSKENI